jgi:hypothetical protein
MFLNKIAPNSLREFMMSEEAQIIVENMNMLEQFSESTSLELVLSEAEKNAAVKAAEAYIEKVKAGVKKFTSASDKAKHISEIWGWVTFGLSVLTICIGAAAAASILSPIVAIIAMLVSAIASAIMVMEAGKAKNYIQELGIVKRKLQAHRDRIESHSVQDKLDDLIFKIEHVEDKVSTSVGDANIVNHAGNIPGV